MERCLPRCARDWVRRLPSGQCSIRGSRCLRRGTSCSAFEARTARRGGTPMMLTVLLALTCGTQLWSKKILTDPGAAAALAPAPIPGTIAQLGAFPRTHKRQSYIVDGTIIEIRPESDSDIHVVIEDS